MVHYDIYRLNFILDEPCWTISYLVLFILLTRSIMAELDHSHHSLNNSSSKQKFSFPKTERFHLPKPMLDFLTQHRYYV